MKILIVISIVFVLISKLLAFTDVTNESTSKIEQNPITELSSDLKSDSTVGTFKESVSDFVKDITTKVIEIPTTNVIKTTNVMQTLTTKSETGEITTKLTTDEITTTPTTDEITTTPTTDEITTTRPTTDEITTKLTTGEVTTRKPTIAEIATTKPTTVEITTITPEKSTKLIELMSTAEIIKLQSELESSLTEFSSEKEKIITTQLPTQTEVKLTKITTDLPKQTTIEVTTQKISFGSKKNTSAKLFKEITTTNKNLLDFSEIDSHELKASTSELSKSGSKDEKTTSSIKYSAPQSTPSKALTRKESAANTYKMTTHDSKINTATANIKDNLTTLKTTIDKIFAPRRPINITHSVNFDTTTGIDESSSRIKVEVESKPSLNLATQIPPPINDFICSHTVCSGINIKIYLEKSHGQYGENTTFKCAITHRIPASNVTFMWSKRNNEDAVTEEITKETLEITSQYNKYKKVFSLLKLTDLKDDNSGYYVCTVRLMPLCCSVSEIAYFKAYRQSSFAVHAIVIVLVILFQVLFALGLRYCFCKRRRHTKNHQDIECVPLQEQISKPRKSAAHIWEDNHYE